VEIFKVTQSYDFILDKIKKIYDLDIPISIDGRFSFYKFERSPRDYDMMLALFTFECAKINVSKIKQISSLFDLRYHVDHEYASKKDLEVNIEVCERSAIQEKSYISIDFGNVFHFWITTEPEGIKTRMVFASTKHLQHNEPIDDVIFEKLYSEHLFELCKYIEPGMTFALFNEIGKKIVDELRIENLKNSDLTYYSKEESGLFFYNYPLEPKDFFTPLKQVFSHNLMHQVKIIESLLRFESNLKYGKTAYELMFNYSLSNHKYRTPTNLYSVVFTYNYEFELGITLYFKFKNNEIRYLEVDLKTLDTVDISGYEAIYEYLHNRIKERLTTQLGVFSDDLTNESVLLYKMAMI
jgi:hypothetical protein